MPPSIHLQSKVILGLNDWINHGTIPSDVDQPASLDHIATTNALELGLTVHAARTDPCKLDRIRQVVERLSQLAQVEGIRKDTAWRRAAGILSAALADDQFRAALELHLQLQAADHISDFVWVTLAKTSGGSITSLHLRLIPSASSMCLPHPRHFTYSLSHKDEDRLRHTMARLFSIVSARHPHACYACQWEVAGEMIVTGSSFTGAAVHAWQRMLQGGCADRHVLIMGAFDPESDVLLPVTHIKQKIEALLRAPHQFHYIDKLVVAHGNLREVSDALKKYNVEKQYELETL